MLTLWDVLQDINPEKMKKAFMDDEIVVLEILDGCQVNLTKDEFDSFVGKESSLVNFSRNLWEFLKDRIPANISIEGHDLLYRKTIFYTQMPTAFAVYYAILNDNDWVMSWDDTVRLAHILDLRCAPVLYRGKYIEDLHKKSYLGISMWRSLPYDDNQIATSSPQMGYMIRPTAAFSTQDKEKIFAYKNPNFTTPNLDLELKKNNILVVTQQPYTHYNARKG